MKGFFQKFYSFAEKLLEYTYNSLTIYKQSNGIK